MNTKTNAVVASGKSQESIRMKHQNLLITLLAVSAFAVGCEKSATENREATAKQIDKVQAETKEAAQEMKNYSYAQKGEFVQKMQGQLSGLNRDLDELGARIEKSSDAVKAEAKPKLQALRDQTVQLNQKLDEVKNASEWPGRASKAVSRQPMTRRRTGSTRPGSG